MAGAPILVVDLDGTLVRSDMLFETFWSALAADWRTPFVAAGSLVAGRAVLKARLALLGPIDVAALPYNDAVLDFVRNWRADGGRTALVTASDQALAEAIASHLGLFDEVHGSANGTNLKGPAKAGFLARRFGEGYAYVGDAAADLPVWQGAVRAIMVNPSPGLKARVAALGRAPEPIAEVRRGLRPYLRAMRPHQWLKNLLVFLPMLAAHDLGSDTIWRSVVAFVTFCLVASGVYVLNDLLDLGSDRAHPRKRNRPLASGDLAIAHGTVLAPGLLLLGLGFALLLGPAFAAVMVSYFVLTTAYSLWLKRRPIIDICMLAGLYTVRIAAGGVAADIPLSVWLLAFSIFFFFSLAAVKRQAELVDGVAAGKVTAHGRGYHVDDLPLVANMAISSGYVAVLVMALYVNSPAVLRLYPAPYLLWGICPVLLYWISRMVMKTHRGQMHDDPVVFAATDRVSLACFVVILALATGGALM